MAGKKEWYVLRAISGKEAKVKELLDAQIKNTSLGDYVSQVLIPTEKIYSTTKSGKKVVKERTLYSGYVFVEAELIGEVTHILRNTTNVIDFLGWERVRRQSVRNRCDQGRLTVCSALRTSFRKLMRPT